MPELWRLITPFVDESFQKDLEKVLATEDTLQMKAAILAIHESDFAPAKKHLEKYPQMIQSIQKGEISWESIGSEFQRTRV
jgi:predicted translin family RNA/ssDNA-binding protein